MRSKPINKDDKQVISVDDFDKKYFPDYYKIRQKELDYQESETGKKFELLLKLFSCNQ